MKHLIDRVLARFGLRLMKSSNLDPLLEQIDTLSGLSGELGRQVEDLGARAAQLDKRATNAEIARQELEKENTGLKEQSRMLSSAMTLLRRQTNRSNARSRPVIFIVMTTVSQIPHLKAFVSTDSIAGACELVVVGYLDIAESSITEFCIANDIALLNHNFDIVCCPDGLRVLLTIDDKAAPYFGSNLSLADFDADGGELLEWTNKLLAEVYWQNSVAMQADILFRRMQPSALVLFEDNAAYHTGIWVAVSRRHAVPSIVFPYAIIDAADAAEAHFNDPLYWADEGPVNKFVKKVLPQWSFSHRDRALLRRPAIGALSSEVLGFAQPQPWVWNSTRADVLAVESQAMFDVYRSQGILEQQIQITGSVSDDLLHDALANKEAIRRELGFDARRPIIVCAFPPNQLSVNRPDPEFQDFRTIVERWLGELAKTVDWQVVIKPHPAMLADDVAFLSGFGFPVTSLDTTSLIAICDIFNTSVSSTIRWALACGKPTLNYDVYRYRYRDFVDEPAVVTVYDFAEFSSQLARLTGDNVALQDLTERARAASSRWGLLDGKCAERMVSIIDQLIDRSAGTPKPLLRPWS